VGGGEVRAGRSMPGRLRFWQGAPGRARGIPGGIRGPVRVDSHQWEQVPSSAPIIPSPWAAGRPCDVTGQFVPLVQFPAATLEVFGVFGMSLQIICL